MHDNHSWTTQSSHRTSEGTVTYLRCSCGQFLVRSTAPAPQPAAEIEITPTKRCPVPATG